MLSADTLQRDKKKSRRESKIVPSPAQERHERDAEWLKKMEKDACMSPSDGRISVKMLVREGYLHHKKNETTQQQEMNRAEFERLEHTVNRMLGEVQNPLDVLKYVYEMQIFSEDVPRAMNHSYNYAKKRKLIDSMGKGELFLQPTS